MKKRVSLFLYFIIVALFLCGCSKDDVGAAWKGINSAAEGYYDESYGETTIDDVALGNTEFFIPTIDTFKRIFSIGVNSYVENGGSTEEIEKAQNALDTASEIAENTIDTLSEKADTLVSDAGDGSNSSQIEPRLSDEDLNIITNSIPGSSKTSDLLGGELEIHYIDVGQGDCTLIKATDKEGIVHSMLIDAGLNDQGMQITSYLKKQGITTLDALCLTHNHADHIGSADVVIEKMKDIGTIFMSDIEVDTATFRDVKQSIKYMNYNNKVVIPTPGSTYKLGDAYFTFIGPNGIDDGNINNSSIGLILVNGNNRFLFTGDAEESEELAILSTGVDISCDVYQAGHHGSKTASSQSLLDAASPLYCVISCGESNSYYHPHASFLNKIRKMGIKCYRTDEQGSVVCKSDGSTLSFNCSPSETWKAGEGSN